MNNCSQSNLKSDACSSNYSSSSNDKIDTTNTVHFEDLPLDIWKKIISYLPFSDLKLFTEHKVEVLKKPLDGTEDTHRLMIGKNFIFYKKDFLDVVNNVYNLARSYKFFYILTERERTLLVEAAKWARIDKEFLFSDQTTIEKKQDENTKFLETDSIFQIAPVRVRDLIPPQYRGIPKQPSVEFFANTIKEEILSRQKSQIECLISKDNSKNVIEHFKPNLDLFKPLNLDAIFFEKFNLTVDVNQESAGKKDNQLNESEDS